MNVPYVKNYATNGILLNPISSYQDGKYVNQHPNRQQRRGKIPRFKGNKKGISLTVNEGLYAAKYKRIVQEVVDIKGKVVNVIYHYAKQIVRTKKK